MTFQFNNVKWGISERKNGAMSLSLTALNKENLENRKKYFESQEINPENVVAMDLGHTSNIVIVKEEDRGKIFSNTDGFITNRKNVFLTTTVADCLPIYIYDSKKELIGLLHAGWRGITDNIIKTVISVMKDKFNSKAENIYLHIGPHIQKCHFEIKEDILSYFQDKFVIRDKNALRVNLFSLTTKQALESGVSLKNISSSNECTYCNREKYFSYRRDKSKEVKSMVAYIGVF